ncbi:MAG: flagellar basal body-associated protein FliL [Acidobacteriota bacterium]
MADEKAAPGQENPDDADTKAASGGSSKKLLVIGLAAALALGGGGATVFFMMKGAPDPPLQADASAVDQPSTAGAAIFTVDPIIVNLAGLDSNRFAKCTVRLLLPNEDAVQTVAGDDILLTRLRDRILTLLASKTYAEVNTPVGKETLRREIMQRANTALGNIHVSDVFFTEFMIQ